jgi:hypothetical protein
MMNVFGMRLFLTCLSLSLLLILSTIGTVWSSGANNTAVNRVSHLIRTNRLESKLTNENYCKAKFGVHASQVIMDAADSLRISL